MATDLLGVASRVPDRVQNTREHPASAEAGGDNRIAQATNEGRADNDRQHLEGILVRA